MVVFTAMGKGLAICACLFGSTVIFAQDSLTIDRIFGGQLEPEAGPLTGDWLPGSSSMIDVKSGQVVVTDARTGKQTVLVKAAELKGFPAETASKTGSKVLLFGNSRKVWRLNTRGDYAVFDLKTRQLTRLGSVKLKSELMFAKLSPDGSRVGYVFHNNIFVYDFARKRTSQITFDGTSSVINGTFDWVYEEELGLRDGWRWSPDGRSIAFWQVDSRPESIFTLIDQSGKTQVIKKFPYPHPGGANANVRIGVVSSEGGQVRWVKPVATSWNGYLARMDWVPNSKNLLVQFLNRKQNRLDFYLVDSRPGKEKLVWTDKDAAWVDVNDTGPTGVAWLPNRQFVTFSEMSGQRHIYAVSLEGKAVDLSSGLDVDPFSVQVVGESVYFLASPSDAAQRYLYRTTVKSPNPERVSSGEQAGTHQYSISPNGELAVHEFSRLGQPPIKDVVELSSHRKIRELTTNQALNKSLEAIEKGRIERRMFMSADGNRTMDGIVVYPPNFDRTKRYPVFFDIYGGPAGTTVNDKWLGVQQLFWWHLASKGYIIATVDNRGTPALKDRAWRKSIYLNMTPIIAADLAAAGRQMAALPFVDASRIGIWGWSSGGTNTLASLFNYPDIWSLGIAVAPGTDISLYDTIYTERYSGTPSENPKTYFNDSPVNFVKGLKGHLLIAHGTGDDNCHFQNTEWLIDRLVAERKKFTVMPYPNRTHEVSEGPGTTEHLFETIVDFLTTHMPGGPMR